MRPDASQTSSEDSTVTYLQGAQRERVAISELHSFPPTPYTAVSKDCKQLSGLQIHVKWIGENGLNDCENEVVVVARPLANRGYGLA